MARDKSSSRSRSNRNKKREEEDRRKKNEEHHQNRQNRQEPEAKRSREPQRPPKPSPRTSPPRTPAPASKTKYDKHDQKHNKDEDKKTEKNEQKYRDDPRTKSSHKDKHKKRSRSTSSSSGSSSSRRGRTSAKKAHKHSNSTSKPQGKISDEKHYDACTKYDLTKDIQSEWSATDEFLDTNLEKGLPLPKIVKNTEFSQKNGTAAKDIRTVRLIDVCYQGLKNHNLRSIAAGRFINIIFTKSIKENQFITKLIYNMRPEWKNGKPSGEGLDLQDIGAAYAATHSMEFNVDADKQKVYHHLADEAYKHLKGLGPESDHKKMLDRLRILEEENAKLKTSNTPKKEEKKKRKAKNIHDFFAKDVEDKDKAAGIEKDESDSDEDPDSEPEPIMAQLGKPPSAKRYLKKNTPKGTSASDISKFITTLDIMPKTKSKIDQEADRILKFYLALPIIKRSGLKEAAVDWGLPVSLANKANHKELIKLCTIAKTLST